MQDCGIRKSQLCFLWSRQGRINQEEQGTLTGAAVSPDRRAEPQRRKQHQHSPQSRENRCSWKLFWKMGKLESLEELPTCICLSSFSSGEERENSRHVILISQACRDVQSGLIHLWEEQSHGITGDVGAQCSVVQRASGMVGIIREEIEENHKRLLDTTLNPSHICEVAHRAKPPCRICFVNLPKGEDSHFICEGIFIYGASVAT
ncbi:uncharacterized protein LOC108640397 [Manacus vitellinus]|uniref:uncharacterized protein LOC108640397 n=1 Tax=Manacus vitellinus TaxID=328815 RepID=UPI00115DC041|nr:uncharacterized protein LOC108640397 [Manacus vitellinus]